MAAPISFGSASQQMPAADLVNWYSRIVISIVVLGIAVSVWLGTRAYRESRHRETCRANLRQIGDALQAYHDRYESFPPAFVIGPTGQRFHSWRVLLLPFLGQQELYSKYHFDEPWNGLHNRKLAEQIPSLFACPSSGSHSPGVTNYLAVAGPTTAWPEQYSARRVDFADGASNTVQIIESSDSDILWLEPRDLTYQQAVWRGQPANAPSLSSRHRNSAGFTVLMADGASRFISHQITPEILRSMLSINGGRPLAGIDWPPLNIAEPVELPSARTANDFRATDVLPYPTGAICPGRNYVYCASFEIAWEEARRALGGGPIGLEGAPPLATQLNDHSFNPRNLSPDSYLARGGRGTHEFRTQLLEEMTVKFPKSGPRLLNDVEDEHALLLYAYLLKSLRFETAFDKLSEPLQFQTADGEIPVRSFGVRHINGTDARSEQLQAQVHILAYQTDDDFILQLASTESHDEIVLAKVKPDKTLAETVSAVSHRITNPHLPITGRQIVSEEPLVIPRLIVSIERRYSELVGRDIIGASLHVSEAIQVVRFRLDETGALLESEAALVADDTQPPVGQRKFIFDRPFLIYLIEHGADQPYFAAWVANTELMESVGESRLTD